MKPAVYLAATKTARLTRVEKARIVEIFISRGYISTTAQGAVEVANHCFEIGIPVSISVFSDGEVRLQRFSTSYLTEK